MYLGGEDQEGGLFVILAVVGGVFSETVGCLHFALSALVTDLACQFVSFRCCWRWLGQKDMELWKPPGGWLSKSKTFFRVRLLGHVL